LQKVEKLDADTGEDKNENASSAIACDVSITNVRNHTHLGTRTWKAPQKSLKPCEKT
jgi:hypothetical protein